MDKSKERRERKEYVSYARLGNVTIRIVRDARPNWHQDMLEPAFRLKG